MAVTATITIAAPLSTQASLEVQDLTYTALVFGEPGNLIEVEYVDPASADSPLSVSVTDGVISVSLETDSGEDLISTADDVLAALVAESDVTDIVSVTLTGTGSNVQAAQASAPLEGGESIVAYNGKATALVAVANGGVSAVNIVDMRLSGSSSALVVERWSSPITPLSVGASASVVVPFTLIGLIPQIAGGPSTEPSSYTVTCDVLTSDGQVVSASEANLTILPF